MNDKQFEIKWIYCVLKEWGGQTYELNANEREIDRLNLGLWLTWPDKF